MAQPLISVIIPCYNVSGFISWTLNSILEQTYPRVEILVIDDGSTDTLEETLAPYRERIRFQRIPNSGGPSRPRNVGLEMANGDLISLCDADDMMLPDKLASATRIFENHPEVDFLFTNFQTCDKSGEPVNRDFLAEYRDFREFLIPLANNPALSLMNGDNAYRCLLRANFIGTSSVVFRAKIISEVGGFDETMLNSDDKDLWRRIARHGHKFAFLDEIHHSYRIRRGSISHKNSGRYPALIKGAQKQLPHCSNEEDLRFMESEIHRLWLGYGYALRIEGKRRRSIAAFREALTHKIDWVGIRGLVLSFLNLKRRRPNQ